MKELLRACWVIARRDYTAIVFSKAFFFFLLGPLFPLIVGGISAMVGSQVAESSMRPTMGVVMNAEDLAKLRIAEVRLAGELGDVRIPPIAVAPAGLSPEDMLADKKQNAVIVLSGTLEQPLVTGKRGDVDGLTPRIALLVSAARAGTGLPDVVVSPRYVAESRGAEQRAQLTTSRFGQIALLMLTMLLAGMVLSNLVEEKTNKIIEVLTSAVPVDAIFVGKLFAMLAMALTGIAVWAVVGITGFAIWGGQLPPLPVPAVGWPMFLMLGVTYFATAYLLLGSMFVGIGAQASTVREVQILSMPVTMAQVLVFLLAGYVIDKIFQPLWFASAIFPFSSPFTMLAMAAQDGRLWLHLVAILWQLLCVAVILRIGVVLFRRNVLKSGRAGKAAKS